MKLILSSLLALVISIGAFQSSAFAGDLHRKTMHDWKRATMQNRVETVIDFVKAEGESKTPSAIMLRSVAILSCMEEGGANSLTDHLEIGRMAAMCMIMVEN